MMKKSGLADHDDEETYGQITKGSIDTKTAHEVEPKRPTRRAKTAHSQVQNGPRKGKRSSTCYSAP